MGLNDDFFVLMFEKIKIPGDRGFA